MYITSTQRKVGLLVGRFQPFHNGHLKLLKEIFKYCDTLKIGLGSANIQDDKNPIRASDRVEMINKVIEFENFGPKISQIALIDDVHDDQKWLEEVQNKVGRFDICFVGKNDWVKRILKPVCSEFIEIGLFERNLYEGTKIRELIRNGKNWQNRVPKYLVEAIKNKINSRPNILSI